eukprot:jgi/Galph1/3066/GphlegSOOS_G1740.1
MVRGGNLVIAIVIPIVIPIGLAMFVFFFTLQYKYLKRVRVRLEFEEQLARTHRVRGTGLTRYDILHHCPLIIYRGSTKVSLHPNRPIIEENVLEENKAETEDEQVAEGKQVTYEALADEDKQSTEQIRKQKTEKVDKKLATKKGKKGDENEKVGDALLISVINPGNMEMLSTSRHSGTHANVAEVAANSGKEAATPLLSAKSIPGGVCAVCIEEVKKGSRLRLLRCGHAFHTRCIERWLASVNPADGPQTATVETSARDPRVHSVQVPVPTHNHQQESPRGFARITHWFREAFSDVPPDLIYLQEELYRQQQMASSRPSTAPLSEEDGASEEGRLSSMYRDGDNHIVEFTSHDGLQTQNGRSYSFPNAPSNAIVISEHS